MTAASSDLPPGDKYEVVALDAPSGPLQLLSRRELRRVAELMRRADVIHFHGLWRPRNVQMARVARRLGQAYIVSPHGMLNSWAMAQGSLRKRAYYRLFERSNLDGARAVHFASEREREQAAAWVPHDRLRVIPLALDLRPFEDCSQPEHPGGSPPEVDTGPPTVLMLGRLHPGKRAELLIEAVSILSQAGVECRLALAGPGDPSYVERLRDLARSHGIAGRTEFPGLVMGTAKVGLLQRATVTALPTVGESFGLVLFESLACGTPVVTTRGADTWREISDSGGGRIVEATAGAFAETMAELLSDADLRKAMGRAGRRWVFERLDPRSVVDQYREMYRQVSSTAAPV